MDRTTRRAVIAGAGLIAAPAVWTAGRAQGPIADYPFTLGVASGDPVADGMVLWTRLARRPLEPDAGMGAMSAAVRWEVAEDERFRRPVASGAVTAGPEDGHSVHVEVKGLRPGREYWYRFVAGGHGSPVGRTRTTPAPDAEVDRLRIAYGSCQKYEHGYYAAHRDLADSHPDLVLFLGDYIYEGPKGEVFVRPHPAEEAKDLASYRRRYALYKADPDLQASHAAAPWVAIWDDHEVANDYGSDQDRTNPDPQVFLRRRQQAYRAFWENMPMRQANRPTGADMRIFRSLDWGRLAQFRMLDTREYRDHRTCDEIANEKMIPDCPARSDPRRSLLGAYQERWLHEGLKASKAQWNILGQQYLIGSLRHEDGRYSNDGWGGYVASRNRLLETWRDGKVKNPVALGGDIHCFFAGELALDPAKPIASEFVGGSIASVGRSNKQIAQHLATNPNLKFGEGERRGYGRVEITRKRAEVTFRQVENAGRRDSPVRDLVKFVVEDGRPGFHKA